MSARTLFLSAGLAVLSLVIVWYICAFYVIDIDVWWHIAAGRIIRSTGELIQFEPFAYTRSGQPYLATQSWLAQIILSFVYDIFGAKGLIILRSICITLAVLPAFLLQRRVWVMAPLVVYAVASMRPVILDRPQLFSFVIFAMCLYLAVLWLRDSLSTKAYLLLAGVLQVLWVNMHGGAALIHVVLVVGVLIQAWHTPKLSAACIAFGVVLCALFVSPNFLHTFGYVQDLFTDKTVGFIQEWMPRKPWNYLRWVAPWWALVLCAVWIGKKYPLLSALYICVFGFFSLQAIRHEPFFILSAILIIALQCTTENWQRIFRRIEHSVWMPICISLIALAGIGFSAKADKYIATGRLGLNGYGAYEPVRHAF